MGRCNAMRRTAGEVVGECTLRLGALSDEHDLARRELRHDRAHRAAVAHTLEVYVAHGAAHVHVHAPHHPLVRPTLLVVVAVIIIRVHERTAAVTHRVIVGKERAVVTLAVAAVISRRRLRQLELQCAAA
eukprot:3475221-Prymnesium_polylepis.2